MMIFVGAVQPIFTVWLYTLNLPSGLDDGQAFWFILINAGLVNSWTILVFSTLSEIDRDRWTGLLAQYISVPTQLVEIMSIRTLANFCFVFLSLIVTAGLTFIVIGPDSAALFSTSWFWLVLALVSITLLAVLFSMIVAMTVRGRTIMNFIEYPVVFVSALGFSVTLFPNILTQIALCLPHSFLAEMARFSAGVSPINPMELGWSMSPVMTTIGLVALGGALLSKMQKRLLEKGALG